ncbi:MAG: AI-2E family transporter [Patescibacteria group bacterium]|nr:AI-2E family transporter [Patescibacteria group bacterium]
MTNKRLQVISFFSLLAVAALVVLLMWWPYLKVIALAAILAILFLPLHKRISREIKWPSLAAFVTTLLILLIVIIPLYIIGQLLFNELSSVYDLVKSGQLNLDQTAIVSHLPAQVREYANNILSGLGQKLSSLSINANSIANALSTGAGFILSFFLVFFTVFYLLRDGSGIKKYISSIFPLAETHENQLVTKLENAVNGVVKGSFLVALTQGAVATIGFLIFGVPQPFLWGAFTVLAALVPTVGTSISLIPAVIYLLVTGHTGAGIGMAIWGAAAVGTIDNIISPYLVGSRTQLHPLLVLFSIIGGLDLFGVIGFLLGPIIMAVFVTLLDIYRTDLKEYLEK